MTTWTQQTPESVSWTLVTQAPTLTVVAGTPIGLLLALTKGFGFSVYADSPFSEVSPTSVSWTKEEAV